MTPRRIGQVAELDCVRGVAIILVFCTHLWIIWPTWVFHRVMSSGGFLGVDLFFVLSGFLITGMLLGEQAVTRRMRIGSFYWRRALRLVPALVFFLAAHLVYALLNDYPPFGDRGNEWRSILHSLTFTMNWHVLWDPFGAADHTPIWSLAIEAQFYLVWPLVIVTLIGLHRGARTALAVQVGVLAAVTVWRLVLFRTRGWDAAYLRSDSHIDGLLMGSLAASAWVRGWVPARLPRWLLWAGVAVAGLVVSQAKADRQLTYAGGTTVFLLASAAVVLVAVSSRRPALGPLGQVLAWIGRFSYGFYLWHFAVFFAVTRRCAGWSNEARLGISLFVIAVGVTASRFLVELPVLRRKPHGPREDPPLIPAFGGPAAPPPG